MRIAVTDANIFIDLIKLDLLDCMFGLDMEIHTTREVFDQLNAEQSAIAETFLHTGELHVYNFSWAELQEIYDLDCPKGLETADKTVYYYSTKVEAIVLSGDKKLRTFCLNKKLDVKGILWLFDQFVEKEILTKGAAAERIEFLLSFNNRLPIDECEHRLKIWK